MTTVKDFDATELAELNNSAAKAISALSCMVEEGSWIADGKTYCPPAVHTPNIALARNLSEHFGVRALAFVDAHKSNALTVASHIIASEAFRINEGTILFPLFVRSFFSQQTAIAAREQKARLAAIARSSSALGYQALTQLSPETRAYRQALAALLTPANPFVSAYQADLLLEKGQLGEVE